MNNQNTTIATNTSTFNTSFPDYKPRYTLMNMTNTTSHSYTTSDSLDYMYNIIYTVAVVVFCTGFPPNLIIIYVITTVRKLRSPINKIVVSLAVADCIYLLWFLISVLDQVHRIFPYSESLYKFFYPSIDMFMASASIVNVAALSVDRLVGCWYPLRYESVMLKKAPRIICFSWVYSITICLVAFVRIALSNETYQNMVFYGSVLLSFALPVLTVVLSYGSILFCAHESIKRTKVLHKSVTPPSHGSLLSTDNDSQSSLHLIRRKNKGFYRELKVTIIILIIVLPFTIGWCFHVGFQIYEDFNKQTITNFTLNILYNVTPSIVSSFNPYVYFMLSKSFRNELRRKVGKALFGDRYTERGCFKPSSRRQNQSSVQMQTMSSVSSQRYSISARGSVGGISSKAV